MTAPVGVRESAVSLPGQELTVDGSSADPASSLTPRQMEALRLTASGLSYKEAAAVMGVELQTLKEFHRQAHRRLGVGTAIEAMRVLGWVTIP